MSSIFYSPAKINLFLHNIGMRSDGYHELETIFILLAYYDKLMINTTDDGRISRIGENNNINITDDLIIKSAKLLQLYSQTKFGANIQINKKIPIGGGLGGGSSNAATILLALNKMWNINFSIQKLQQIGLELGADVPLFIGGKNAFASGIGEVLTTIEVPQYYYLILQPQQQNSTKQIFSHFSLTTSRKQGKIPNFLQSLSLDNDCLNAAIKLNSGIKIAMDYLNIAKNSLTTAKLSGTGSCVFSIFKNYTDAEVALKNIDYKKMKGFIAKSI